MTNFNDGIITRVYNIPLANSIIDHVRIFVHLFLNLAAAKAFNILVLIGVASNLVASIARLLKNVFIWLAIDLIRFDVATFKAKSVYRKGM